MNAGGDSCAKRLCTRCGIEKSWRDFRPGPHPWCGHCATSYKAEKTGVPAPTSYSAWLTGTDAGRSALAERARRRRAARARARRANA